MPATPSSSLLTRKAGPLPVWTWALGGLGAAYAYSRHQANKAAAANTTGTTAAGEPASGQPEYLIENNLPSYAAPSAPVVTPVAAPPAITPPGTGPLPPVNVTPAPPVIQGANPPVSVVSKPPSAPKPAPAPAPKPAPAPAKKAPIQYKVVSGDNLSSIATRYHTTAAALYTYNTTPGNRSASDIATIKQRGPNLIYAGETILIPQ